MDTPDVAHDATNVRCPCPGCLKAREQQSEAAAAESARRRQRHVAKLRRCRQHEQADRLDRQDESAEAGYDLAAIKALLAEDQAWLLEPVLRGFQPLATGYESEAAAWCRNKFAAFVQAEARGEDPAKLRHLLRLILWRLAERADQEREQKAFAHLLASTDEPSEVVVLMQALEKLSPAERKAVVERILAPRRDGERRSDSENQLAYRARHKLRDRLADGFPRLR
jgi:hypothetical protein